MTVADDVIKINGKEDEVLAGRSPFQDAFREFKRNRIAVGSVFFIALMVTMAILADFVTPYSETKQNTEYARQKTMVGYVAVQEIVDKECHWANTPLEWGCYTFIAGSDSLGRDLWSRVVYGSRVSLLVAIVASSVSLIIGTVYGTISGFAGGAVDNVMMRIVDFMYAVPLLPLIILLTVYLKSFSYAGEQEGFIGFVLDLDKSMGGLLIVFIALGALNWIGMARLARGQVLSYKRKEFIEAAHAIGATDSRIIFRHLIPNIIGPLLIAESLAIPGYIFTEATLSFIGLGVNPPTPSWGAMINEGAQGIKSNPHLVLFPGTALVLLTLAFNFMGDGLRDAFDPRLRGR